MAEFFALTSRGLVEPLEAELAGLGLKVLKRTSRGVFFESSWEGCYKANLYSRLATKILKPVLEFTAYQPEELYGQILKHDFTKYISSNQSIAVDASVGESKFRDQRFLAMKVKDAIVDQFREKTGERPNVDKDNPDLEIHVFIYKNHCEVSINTSGPSLFKRGYRQEKGDAPLKEHVAAALVKLAEWDRQTPIVDPMCGSGTILIEAALMALNIAPGTLRRGFAFQNLKNFESEKWDQLVQEAIEQELEELDLKLFGFDISGQVLNMAKGNAKRAGVDHLIEFRKSPITTLKAPCEKGIIITNPPYGSRLGDEYELIDVYRDFSHTLKVEFKGWSAWILAGNKDLIAEFKLKASRKFFIMNGPIECRFLRYDIF